MMRMLLLVTALVTVVGCGKKKDASPGAGPGSGPGSTAVVATPPSAPGSAQAPNVDAKPTACDQAAKDVPGNEGTSWFMQCPAGCAEGTVWGTDVYTDDSELCPAAVHAGAITAKDGGVVQVTWTPGQPTYIGSVRNGITTSDYASWGRSFFVQKIDATGKPTTPAPPLMTAKNTAHLSCKMDASPLTGDAGAKWNVDCPAGCEGSHVWGSGPYTGDSNVCSAAIHAGVIDAKGGGFVVTIGGKVPSFKGSAKNGITTSDYEAYDRTYTIEAVAPASPPAPAPKP
ncbi:MAG TPA: LCCL domain-containing protein [Kofleriaceae bacterium]|nr:LCCL domain-containing protein [Kofleriaceae bacterium]